MIVCCEVMVDSLRCVGYLFTFSLSSTNVVSLCVSRSACVNILCEGFFYSREPHWNNHGNTVTIFSDFCLL